MHIERANHRFDEACEQFVQGHAGGLIYYSLAYRDLLRRLLGCEDHWMAAVEGDKVRGVLPVMGIGAEDQRIYNALPFYGSHGAILADGPEPAQMLVDAWNELVSRPDTAAATLIENPFAPLPEGIQHNWTDERIAQFTPLGGPDEILARCDPSARRNVNKARRSGIHVAKGVQYLDPLYALHQQNITALGGQPKPRRFFELLATSFCEGQQFDIFAALLDGQVVAALLVLYFHHTVEYFTPAIDPHYRHLQPLALILITAMTEACQRGFRRWNWGGTWLDQQGVYRFKRKWGAQQRPYRYLTQVNDPSLMERSAEQLRGQFPGFYVVPFRALGRSPV